MNDKDLLSIFMSPERATLIQLGLGLLRPSFLLAILNGADPSTFSIAKSTANLPVSQLAQLSQDTRTNYQKQLSQKVGLFLQDKLKRQLNQDKVLDAIVDFSNLFMPSTMYGAAKDAITGNNSFIGSMIEGNGGLGNPYSNFAFDVISPIALARGLQVGSKVASKLIPEYSIRMVNAPWAGSLLMGGMPSKIPILLKVIYKTTRPGLPYYESDLEALKVLKPTEHNVNGQIRRVYKLDGKQPMTELEYDNLMGKYFKVNTLSDKEVDKIVKQFEQDGIIGFSVPEWKTFRKGFSTTDRDIAEYKSHLPEYYNKYLELRKNGNLVSKDGKWFGKINEKLQLINPRQYIRSQSKNFQDNGWKFNGLNRGTAMKPETAEVLQNNGGLGAPNWTTTSNKHLSKFSHERDDGLILRGVVGKSDKPTLILPSVLAHLEENNYLKGITDFDVPIEYLNYGTGTWRIYGPDLPITSIDANTGRFKNVLNSLIPLTITGSLARFLYNQNNK